METIQKIPNRKLINFGMALIGRLTLYFLLRIETGSFRNISEAQYLLFQKVPAPSLRVTVKVRDRVLGKKFPATIL